MTSTAATPRATDSETLKQVLIPAVQEALTLARRRSKRALRIEIPVASTDAQAWCAAQSNPIKVYWWGRERTFEVAGIGAACHITGESGIEAVIDDVRNLMVENDPHMRVYGGLAFDPKTPPPTPWDSFGNISFWLPRVELMNRCGRSFIACHVLAGADSCAESELEAVAQTLDGLSRSNPEYRPELPSVVSTRTQPDKAEWIGAVSQILEDISAGSLEKIVLGRETIFQFSQAPYPSTLLRHLADLAARSFLFLFQPRLGTAFVGASPERLYRRLERHIETEAIAGTRPRGENAQADEAYAEALLSSEKDLREHRYVTDAIKKALDQLCTCTRNNDRISLLQLRQCQHLIASFEGTLTDGISDATILNALHPTPAVGGTPREAAQNRIYEHEPFPRGWYAGSVGWISASGAEFAVAIRTALLHGHSVATHCGAGIVSGSSPEAEWDEIGTKMRVMEAALSGGHE